MKTKLFLLQMFNFNIMKKIIICLAVCTVVLCLSSCKTTYRCRDVKIPANLKPISCDAYNDVATIYWNLLNDCNEIGVSESYPCDSVLYELPLWFDGPLLLIEGWGRKQGNFIILCPDSISAASEDVEKASNYINLYLHWPVSGGIVVENSVDYYHIICQKIRQYTKNDRGSYRIELWGGLFFSEPPENYINE